MDRVGLYVCAAIFMVVCAYFSIVYIHNIAETFIEITKAGAIQMRELLVDEDNIIRSITPEQREIWVSNLSNPRLQATGIIVLRDLFSFAVGLLFLGYGIQLLVAAYKTYNKSIKQDK